VALIPALPPSVPQRVATILDKAWKQIDLGKLHVAQPMLAEAQQLAQDAGIRSAILLWTLACAADLSNDASLAVEYIAEALQLEKCSPRIWESYVVIRRRVEATFSSLQVTDPHLSTTFRWLQKLGAVDAEAAHRFSQCAMVHGDDPGAMKAARMAIELDPDCSRYRLHLARLLADQGQLDEANEHIQVASWAPLEVNVPGGRA
jgi:tetratricopeptide (TPR) repeat protein